MRGRINIKTSSSKDHPGRASLLWISQPYPGDFFDVIAVIGCGESRPCKMLRGHSASQRVSVWGEHAPDSILTSPPIHFNPLPCSDLGQGVAISTTAFMLPRFFVQTPIFSVSSIVHLHLSIDECSPDAPRIRVAHDPRRHPQRYACCAELFAKKRGFETLMWSISPFTKRTQNRSQTGTP